MVTTFSRPGDWKTSEGSLGKLHSTGQLLSSFEAPNDSPTAGTESARMSEMVRLWNLGQSRDKFKL